MSEDKSGTPERAREALERFLMGQDSTADRGCDRGQDTYCAACDVFGHAEGSPVCVGLAEELGR